MFTFFTGTDENKQTLSVKARLWERKIYGTREKKKEKVMEMREEELNYVPVLFNTKNRPDPLQTMYLSLRCIL